MIGKTWMQSLLPDGRGDWSRGCQVLVSHALADIYGDDVHNVPAVALYALSLMNCRNVSVVQDAPTEKRRRAFRKRHGVPMTTFSRIVLPNQSNAGSGGAGGGGEETRHHMVRGHFKTYTAEKPLMGQHVGTYWWSWQVRGDKSKGNVEQTYEVKV